MLLAHRGLAALATEDQQTAQIGRGQMERMRGVVAPVGGMGAAMRTGDLGAVRITEIPELEQALEISHGLVVQVFRGGLHGLQGLDDGRLAMRPQGGRKLHPFQISLTVGQVQKMLVGHGFLWSKVLGQSLS